MQQCRQKVQHVHRAVPETPRVTPSRERVGRRRAGGIEAPGRVVAQVIGRETQLEGVLYVNHGPGRFDGGPGGGQQAGEGGLGQFRCTFQPGGGRVLLALGGLDAGGDDAVFPFDWIDGQQAFNHGARGGKGRGGLVLPFQVGQGQGQQTAGLDGPRRAVGHQRSRVAACLNWPR